jgi:hypothetical protein
MTGCVLFYFLILDCFCAAIINVWKGFILQTRDLPQVDVSCLIVLSGPLGKMTEFLV